MSGSLNYPWRLLVLGLISLLYSSPNAAEWQRVGGELQWISVGSAEQVWGVGPKGNVYRWRDNDWEQLPGVLAQLSVGADGTAWGVTDQHRIYRWTGSRWQRIDGRLKNIAVGDAKNVWGIGPTGYVFRWDGTRWLRQPGTLEQLTVDARGAVWGVTSAHRIFQWVGQRWRRVGGALQNVTLAEGVVWGVGPTGRVFARERNDWRRRAGTFKQMSGALDGTLWAITKTNDVYVWSAQSTDPQDTANPGFGLGEHCWSNTQCASGFCTDGVCCNSRCSGSCQACSPASGGSGVRGQCSVLVPGLNTGEACGEPSQETSDTSSGTREQGQSCTSSAQCASGFCTDGVCCNTRCNAACQACYPAAGSSGSRGQCALLVPGGIPGESC